MLVEDLSLFHFDSGDIVPPVRITIFKEFSVVEHLHSVFNSGKLVEKFDTEKMFDVNSLVGFDFNSDPSIFVILAGGCMLGEDFFTKL